MPQDVRDLAAFYESPLGQLARRAILREVEKFWPDLRNYRLLGYGFALPYLPVFRGVERAIAAMPAPAGVIAWPQDKNAALLCEEDALPFPDVFFDRILIIHGLESSESLRALLRQLWRVVELEGLMKEAQFEPGRWARALYAPPFETVTGSGKNWETVGRRLFGGIGGVHVVEAAKSVYSPARPALPRGARVALTSS